VTAASTEISDDADSQLRLTIAIFVGIVGVVMVGFGLLWLLVKKTEQRLMVK
jgi:hypothetical protein